MEMSNQANTIAEFMQELMPYLLKCESVGLVTFERNSDGRTFEVKSYQFDLCAEQMYDCAKLFTQYAKQIARVDKLIEDCGGKSPNDWS